MGNVGKAGISLVVVSVLVIATAYILREVSPRYFGGPNIGGGMLVLAFTGIGTIGIALTIAGLIKKFLKSENR